MTAERKPGYEDPLFVAAVLAEEACFAMDNLGAESSDKEWDRVRAKIKAVHTFLECWDTRD
jgi:hypothetical protein